MKIVPCDDVAKKEAPKELTYWQMIEEEGIYKTAPSETETARSIRLLVVKEHGGNTTVLLYFNPYLNKIEPAQPSWQKAKFVKTNEQLCMSIR